MCKRYYIDIASNIYKNYRKKKKVTMKQNITQRKKLRISNLRYRTYKENQKTKMINSQRKIKKFKIFKRNKKTN